MFDDLEIRRSRKASNISQALRSISADDAPQNDGVETIGAEIEVRPIRNDVELDEVHRITHDSYAERGYCDVQESGRLIHYPHLDRIPETTVLVAVANGEIIGTNSWTLDGLNGLPEDTDFKIECDAIRRERRRLSAAWRLATKSSWRSERRVVLALIQETVRGQMEAGVLTAIFTFNPRHERIYRRLLNMKTVARSRGTLGLKNAPAVLMRLDREAVPERWLESALV